MPYESCPNGHYYDSAKDARCPFCESEDAAGVPVPVGPAVHAGVFQPPVGWVVIIDGPGKGRGFRIHDGENRVGRDPSMEIALTGDTAVALRDHVVIEYDAAGNRFAAKAGEGRSLSYLNGEVVAGWSPLGRFDKLLVGKTSLIFVPLAGDRFRWQ